MRLLPITNKPCNVQCKLSNCVELAYWRKSADRTKHGNGVIFFVFFVHCFQQFRGLESQEMKYFLEMY